jgi:hypothetical protein
VATIIETKGNNVGKDLLSNEIGQGGQELLDTRECLLSTCELHPFLASPVASHINTSTQAYEVAMGSTTITAVWKQA